MTAKLSDQVIVVDLTTSSVVTAVGVGDEPTSVAIDSHGNRAYVTNYGSDDVSVIDIPTNTMAATAAVGDGPIGVGVVAATTPIQDLEVIIGDLAEFDLPHGLSRALKAKLRTALDAFNQGDVATVGRQLIAFQNHGLEDERVNGG